MDKLFVSILFLVAIGAIATAKPSGDDIHVQPRNLSFIDHVQRVRDFSCRNPQLRSMAIKDLLAVPPSHDELYLPSSTVLARCDEHTGCCILGHICAPADIQEVKLPFSIFNVIDKDHLRRLETINVFNHTRCHCVPVDQ